MGLNDTGAITQFWDRVVEFVISKEFLATLSGTLLGAFLAVWGAIWGDRRRDALLKQLLLERLRTEYLRLVPSLDEVSESPRLYIPVRLPVMERILQSGMIDPSTERQLFEALLELDACVQRFNICVEANNRATPLSKVAHHNADGLGKQVRKRWEDAARAWGTVEEHLTAQGTSKLGVIHGYLIDVWKEMGS